MRSYSTAPHEKFRSCLASTFAQICCSLAHQHGVVQSSLMLEKHYVC